MTELLRLALPLSAWLVGFSAVYGLQGLTCSRHWEGLGDEAARAALVASWIVAVLVQAAILLALRTPTLASPRPFLQRVSLGLAVVALVAAAWTLAPVATTSRCL